MTQLMAGGERESLLVEGNERFNQIREKCYVTHMSHELISGDTEWGIFSSGATSTPSRDENNLIRTENSQKSSRYDETVVNHAH